MIQRSRQKGFTLIEVAVTLLLFSLTMGVLWEFFSNTYSTYVMFDKKSMLSDQSRITTSFIREEIRSAEGITIEVLTGAALSLEEVNPPSATGPTHEIKGILSQIKFANQTTGPGILKKKRSIKMETNTTTQGGLGKYRLIYTAGGTSSLISDKVENIKVIRDADSSVVQFECIFNEDGETQSTQIIRNIFSESLEYKEKYSSIP